MRIARYENEKGFNCYIFLTESEYTSIRRPDKVSVSTRNTPGRGRHLAIRKAKDDNDFHVCKVQVHNTKKYPWRLVVKSPLLPGGKPFGIEKVQCSIDGEVLFADFPKMTSKVKPSGKRNGKRKKKIVTPLPEETIADLVAELNARRKENNMRFDTNERGDLRIVVTYE